MTYRVRYEIDVEADSPEDAALQVKETLESDDPNRFAPIFEVITWDQHSEPSPDAPRVTIDCDKLPPRKAS